MLTALLFSLFIMGLVWYVADSMSESRTEKERTARALGLAGNSRPVDKSDILKSGYGVRKGFFRTLLEFTAPPTFMQLGIFLAAMSGAAYSIFQKMQAPVTSKLLFLFIAFVIGMRFLKKAAMKHRVNRLRKELPGTLDLIVICLEAGLGMNASFLRVANEMENSPLGVELRQTFNEVSAGIPIDDALKNFARRTTLPEINAIVVSIIQAQKMGSSLAKTFRVQAESLREQIRMKTKEEIMKVPIKILFPLVFFIFPALFVVILGPAFISIMKQFGKGGGG